MGSRGRFRAAAGGLTAVVDDFARGVLGDRHLHLRSSGRRGLQRSREQALQLVLGSWHLMDRFEPRSLSAPEVGCCVCDSGGLAQRELEKSVAETS